MAAMRNPKISVVIPAYNHEDYVGIAIESALRQTVDDLEVVVIDDGSTDKTGEVVKNFDDSRVRYTYQENQDAFNAINNGIAQARGEFIAILNSDDIYAPNRFERLLKAHEAGGAQCLFSDVEPVDANGDPITDPDFGWNQWHKKNRDFYFKCGDLYTAFLKGNFMVTTSNLFMTASAAEKVGKFCSLRYLHDYDFIFRMMLAYPDQVQYVDNERLLFYRIHGGNTLSEAAIKGREEDKQVIRKYMLARVTDDLRPLVDAGADRLVELERELAEVRAMLHGASEPGMKSHLIGLLVAIKRKISRLLK